MTQVPPQDALEAFAAVVGARHVLTAPEDVVPFVTEPRGKFTGRPLCVLRPASTQEVAALLALCNLRDIGVVPQGGRTGLVGGQIPDASGREVVLSLLRLDRIRDVDATSDAMTLEAGVTLARAHQAAEDAGRYFPLSMASEGSCTIGGALSTNAGGVHVVAYGSARALALGLEVVLADGRVMNGLTKLRKDNTGYHLSELFMGAEGTLGVVTAATLKLFPQPSGRATLLAGLPSPQAALALLTLIRGMGAALQAFELIPRIALDFVMKHHGARDPLAQPSRWYALVECAAFGGEEIDERVTALVAHAQAQAQGVIDDAVLAQTLEQRAALWRLRELIPQTQAREGGSIKHDISVPIDRIPDFLEEADALVGAAIPGARPVPFGHMGDGNIHYNVSQPEGADAAAFLARWDEVNTLVHGVVARFGGSISAEHGIGTLKRDLLREVKDPVALDAMRAVKRALDPRGILNPGKVL